VPRHTFEPPFTEYEKMAGYRVLLDDTHNHAGQRVKTPSHVGGFYTKVNADNAGKLQHNSAPSIETTSLNVDRSNPLRTFTDMPDEKRISIPDSYSPPSAITPADMNFNSSDDDSC
jgi:hypothetical protein